MSILVFIGAFIGSLIYLRIRDRILIDRRIIDQLMSPGERLLDAMICASIVWVFYMLIFCF